MHKLAAKWHPYAMALVMTCIMTAVVCAVSTFRVAGVAGLHDKWLTAWLISWAVAFPTLVIIMPLVRFIVSKVVEVPGENKL